MSPPSHLSPAQQEGARVCRAIRLLAEGRPLPSVAQEIRARPETLIAWQQSEDFMAVLRCLRDAGRSAAIMTALADLTPDAIEALRDALLSGQPRVAITAAREVLDRIGIARRGSAPDHSPSASQTIRVEYVNRDGQAVSATPWADRHPAPPGTLQGGGLRTPLREDGDGQDSDR